MKIDLRDLNDIFDTSKCSNPVIDTKKIYFDSRFPEPDGIFFPITGKKFDGEDFIPFKGKNKYARFFSRHEHLNEDYIRIKISNNEALKKLAKYVRTKFSGKTVGITGTSGKTTLKEILSTILSSKFCVHHSKGNFNNLIGLPMSILALEGSEDFGIFELGTNQPGEIKALSEILKPDVSFVTSIGRGHTEFLVDEEGVFLEKREIISETKNMFFTTGCGKFGKLMMDYAKNYRIKAVNLEESPKITEIDLETGTEIEFQNEDKTKLLVRTMLFGDGNINNFFLAISACNIAGWLNMNEIIEASKHVRGEKNRLFPSKVRNGIYYIDDSYNSNPLSLKNGLLFLCQLNVPVKYAVIGDMMEINDHDLKFSAHEIAQIMQKTEKESRPELIFYGNKIEQVYIELKAKSIEKISFFSKDSEYSNLIRSLKTDIESESGSKVIYFKASRGARIEKLMEDLTSALFPV